MIALSVQIVYVRTYIDVCTYVLVLTVAVMKLKSPCMVTHNACHASMHDTPHGVKTHRHSRENATNLKCIELIA